MIILKIYNDLFQHKKINDLEHLYKINLINSCPEYKSAHIIATKSIENRTNGSKAPASNDKYIITGWVEYGY